MANRTRTSSRRLGAAFVGAGALAAGWGALVEPRLIDRIEHDAPIPGLPEAWNGRTVALLADLQVGGRWSNEGTVRRAIDHLVRLRPALVLIAGDVIQGGRRAAFGQIGRSVDLLGPLSGAGLAVYAVLGNHDYLIGRRAYDDRLAAELTRALAGIGVRVLENEWVALDAAARRPLHLVGIGTREPYREDIERAFRALAADAPRICLMHFPQTFAMLPAGVAPFAVAGHTHGGQVRLPFGSRPSAAALVNPAGFYRDGWCSEIGAPGNRLYVSRGLGMSNLPLRIGCPPELTLFRLAAA